MKENKKGENTKLQQGYGHTVQHQQCERGKEEHLLLYVQLDSRDRMDMCSEGRERKGAGGLCTGIVCRERGRHTHRCVLQGFSAIGSLHSLSLRARFLFC